MGKIESSPFRKKESVRIGTKADNGKWYVEPTVVKLRRAIDFVV